MQSWGVDERFRIYATQSYPTKSGVLGLIAAALGIQRGEDTSQLNTLRMGVRIDEPGVLQSDFQTTTDYVKADGGKGETMIYDKMYLSDAQFVVMLESEDYELLSKIERALLNPVFHLFLGRKAYPLSEKPLFALENNIKQNTLEECLAATPVVPLLVNDYADEESDKMLTVIVESENGNQSVRDVPVSTNSRTFASRMVRQYQISLESAS